MLGRIVSVIAGLTAEKHWEPLYWLVIFIISILTYFRYSKSTYTLQVIKAYVVLLIALILFFCISTAIGADFAQNAYDRGRWVNPSCKSDPTGLKELMRSIPMAMLFFDGIEVLPSAAFNVENVRKTHPFTYCIV